MKWSCQADKIYYKKANGRETIKQCNEKLQKHKQRKNLQIQQTLRRVLG